MKPGDELYAFFLTAQGRIISDCYIKCEEDYLLLDVEPEVRESIIQHIDHYIIADDVLLEDVTSSTFALLAGGKRLYGTVLDKQQVASNLGMTEATEEDYETFRIEQYHPGFGKDFSSAPLPQETGLTYALHFSKGCYLGQEIVERIRSRGHVNKMLAGLKAAEPMPVGSKVHLNGEEIGQITSRAGSQAIGMLRVAGTKPGSIVQVETVSAEVHAVS